jgi:hypothetical protein
MRSTRPPSERASTAVSIAEKAGAAHTFSHRRLLARDPVMVSFLVPGVLGVLTRVVHAIPAGLGRSARVESRARPMDPDVLAVEVG